jgi:ABC-type glutathione transport system ATPase component
MYGDSGTGKSALVKVLLDTHFPTATRVWLAPEHLEQAVNEAERVRFGIAHPLIRVLDAAVTPENFLIVDSAERLLVPSRIKAQQLVKQLLELNGSETPLPWRVILVGQTEFWVSGELTRIAHSPWRDWKSDRDPKVRLRRFCVPVSGSSGLLRTTKPLGR